MDIITGNYLLDAVVQDPHDEISRLAFADWLEEESKGVQLSHMMIKARMIRGEIFPYIPDGWGALFPDIYKMATHMNLEVWIDGKRWRRCTDWRKGEDGNVVIRKGFLEKVHARWEVWDAYGEELVKSHPVTRVEYDILPSGWNSESGLMWIASQIPSGVWNFLGRRQMQYGCVSSTPTSIVWATMDECMHHLSEACLEWAWES